MQRRELLAAGLATAALPTLGLAQGLEKPKITISVGGKNLVYYLPLTIAEQLGCFKDEGLDVTIVDFTGGSKALQAGASDVIKVVPESYLLGDRAVYIDSFLAATQALSHDGLFPAKGAQTAYRAMASIDKKIAAAKVDLDALYTNAFAKKANTKYPKS